MDLEQLSRAQLARLAREYMLAAQFNSRTGYAALRINHGDDSYKQTAIDNWMAASPVYTRRMQRALGFAGESDVATIFKGLQLDCGFAHQYFDVRYEVLSSDEGRFWLKSCGALLEAEPRGEEAVRVMCHDIEDPTFDATASATNPRARMRPIHRPPRASQDRTPHCEWRVFIDAKAEPLVEPAIAARMESTQLAQLSLPPVKRARKGEDKGGLDDYRGSVFEELQFERFSQAALVTICQELAVQYHLLVNSLAMVIEDTYGEDAASKVTEFQAQGCAWVVSERLKPIVAPDSAGLDAVLAVLGLHPALQPAAYFNLRIDKLDEHRAALSFGESPALQEQTPRGWHALLSRGVGTGLQSIVRAVEPRATVVPGEDPSRSWEIVIADQPVADEEPLAVQVAKSAVLYRTALQDHIPLLQL